MLRDDRGQSIQIGFILVFGILILLLTVSQAFVVPSQTNKIEFRDFQDAVGDMTRLKDAVSSAASGAERSVTVRTGSTYPSRTLLVNPPPASGRLTTVDTGSSADPATGNITIANAEAVNGEANNTRQYWNGTPTNFTTKAVAFLPNYNRLDAPRMVVSGIAAYRVFDDDSVSPETGQALLRGRTLTIVTIVGDLQAEGLSSSVTLEPVSAATRSVTVTNDSGKPINVSLPIPETTNATAWNQSAIAASIRENPSVLNTTVVGPQRVNISLRRVKSNQRQSFSLKLARVEVREQGDASTVDDPPGRYIIPVTGDNASMAADQTQRVAVEVRDRYNNPVDGANVTFQLFPPPASNKTIDDSYQFLPEKRPVVNVTTAGTDGRAATTFDPFAAEPSAAAERFGTGSAAINSTFPGPDTFNTANTTVNVFNVTVS